MPPVNRSRRRDEDVLARRISYERTKRGWSYAGLATRMARAGCPVDQSAFHKIEKSNPRRRITVDEFAALCEVFGLSPAAMLEEPPAERLSRSAAALLGELEWQQAEVRRANKGLTDSMLSAMIILPQLDPEVDVRAAVRHLDEAFDGLLALVADVMRRLERGEGNEDRVTG